MIILSVPAKILSEGEFVSAGTLGDCLGWFKTYDEDTRRLVEIQVDGQVAPDGGTLRWNVNYHDAERLLVDAGI